MSSLAVCKLNLLVVPQLCLYNQMHKIFVNQFFYLSKSYIANIYHIKQIFSLSLVLEETESLEEALSDIDLLQRSEGFLSRTRL